MEVRDRRYTSFGGCLEFLSIVPADVIEMKFWLASVFWKAQGDVMKAVIQPQQNEVKEVLAACSKTPAGKMTFSDAATDDNTRTSYSTFDRYSDISADARYIVRSLWTILFVVP